MYKQNHFINVVIVGPKVSQFFIFLIQWCPKIKDKIKFIKDIRNKKVKK